MNKNNIISQNINMIKNFYKYFISIILLCFISIVTLGLSKNVIDNYNFYLTKQIIFVFLGVIIMLFFRRVNINIIYKYSLLIYFITLIPLIYVLFFGDVVNGSRSWINLFGVSIQPSEFVKISLLICFDRYINTKYGILKCLLLLIFPSILTFLQPDTGTVLFYLVMFVSIILSFKLSKRLYIFLFLSIFIIIFCYFYLYFFQSEMFVEIFGTSFFYRTDRIINFMNTEGYQINKALISIGNGGIFGNLGNFVIYVPEIITDFMFTNVLTIFGFFGGIVVLIIYFILDINLIKDIFNFRKNKSFLLGLLGVFLYQQIQHIFMNIGLLPITGITLPFLSYGGSSLISYFILFGIFFNLKKYQIDT